MFEYRSTCYTKALRLQALYVPRSSGPLQGFLYAGPDQWTTIFGDKMRDESPFICKCDIPHGTVKTTTCATLVAHCSALVVAGNPNNRRHRALESSQMRRPIMITVSLGGGMLLFSEHGFSQQSTPKPRIFLQCFRLSAISSWTVEPH